MLFYAFMTSRLDYCNVLLGGFSARLINKLQMVQNAAARVLTRTRNYVHISPVLSTLHGLPIKHQIDFKILLTTYKALNGLAPQYKSEVLSHYSPSRPLRSQNSGCLIIPRITKPTAGGRSFFYLAPKLWNNLTNTVLLLWHSTEAVAFFSPRPPLFSLLALQYCLIYWETLSALFFKLRNYGFDQLVSQHYWHHLLDKKLGFRGTCLPGRNVRSWLHDGRVGEVANRVSSGSFRGGHWRYLPIWNHDNRYFADWIRLCPGLSKNSENGNSCPKPHKAARHVWSSGKSGQHWDWDY